ncbi:alpha/beta hydrolase [Microbacteriaceae bacterium K1510]|nr:alpha/beta hydrolase [Microbacteriaceae bacterium K1510]
MPKSGWFQSGPVKLHYVAWGAPDATPVVALHGLRAYGWWFAEFGEAAQPDFRVLALDQRGRGNSGWAPDGRYNTDAYVADLEAFRQHLGLDWMILVGHSMGGTNIVNYAALYPQRVGALVIVDSAPELHIAGLTRIREELGRTPASFDSRASARGFLRGLHPRASEANLDTRVAWMLREGDDGRLAWRIDSAIFDPKMTPDPPERMWTALRQIACPTLIVRGGISDLITPDVVDRMLAALKDGRAVDVPDAAHMVVEDNPDGFNAAVLPFLKSVTA